MNPGHLLLFTGAVTLALLFSAAGLGWAFASGQFCRMKEGANVIFDETDADSAGKKTPSI